MPDAWGQFPDAKQPDAWAQFPDVSSDSLRAAQYELSGLRIKEIPDTECCQVEEMPQPIAERSGAGIPKNSPPIAWRRI